MWLLLFLIGHNKGPSDKGKDALSMTFHSMIPSASNHSFDISRAHSTFYKF